MAGRGWYLGPCDYHGGYAKGVVGCLGCYGGGLVYGIGGVVGFCIVWVSGSGYGVVEWFFFLVVLFGRALSRMPQAMRGLGVGSEFGVGYCWRGGEGGVWFILVSYYDDIGLCDWFLTERGVRVMHRSSRDRSRRFLWICPKRKVLAIREQTGCIGSLDLKESYGGGEPDGRNNDIQALKRPSFLSRVGRNVAK